ncbi:hypothetical protein FZD47_20865 [Bacillus infantis]|uniref:ATP-dependent DNA ligase family profile domain-containing protein n=1 Tax=Bacillus infantis TaxID=324767 RepID=A0A5D4SAM0_9BACI|nr:hypothetical protein [Bacillus infantis]TYS60663.1 hypothetical protein FZD47_20865 [Bacillus infantis]
MFVSPMLLHKSEQPFEDSAYITELKVDGIRLILSKFNGQTKLYTRHHNEVTSKFPELHRLNLPDGIILDGEIIVTDLEGKPDFEAMMERFQSKRSEHDIQYCVFDILYYKDQSITHLPLLKRKDIIEQLIENGQHLAKVQWVEGNAPAYFELTKQHGLEGIVQKRINSDYQISKRSKDWLKVINYKYTKAYITGLRKGEFGLLLGIEDRGIIKPAGIMEFVPPLARKQFYGQYRELIIGEDKKFIHLDPKIKCQVKFRNFTKKGMLRIPSFVDFET